jgi:DTW domain-containing protein YfiP
MKTVLGEGFKGMATTNVIVYRTCQRLFRALTGFVAWKMVTYCMYIALERRKQCLCRSRERARSLRVALVVGRVGVA